MESQAAAQWVALGGATLLLIWLLRFAAKYQSIMTSGAYQRIEALEKDLDHERIRCARLESSQRDLNDEIRALRWEIGLLKRKYDNRVERDDVRREAADVRRELADERREQRDGD